MLLLRVSVSSGHPEGVNIQRNTIITNTVKMGIYGIKIQCYHVKYSLNVSNVDQLMYFDMS